ncbi:hypothetical protein ALO95_200062 [Pseudomonas syringae pv. antirrhini]|uniref:hypothetical protein n=1 Tax=Pseudomonadota TaxID=1224 RepID=UPI000F3C0B8C|nr:MULTISPECIES: hypothetical protein [Pseudomonadota]RMP31518.1 hypothetical protein ALQ24_200106 [Pseudomonas syringae pv. antirrhini]RMW30555.1 hypothetical protein ALO95_200062 [Pseudomonas syringae pv. antirrhini]WIN09719.1 hypothetical protein QQF68_13070 [Pseudomonas syringae pv. antirrhini str. 126]WIN09721.1 hypothetical protein QQF68_13080 [Pseudomonas syringae pv. antirrhini str. 126]WIN09723.1 hypothetical protein QQF68_13090 [Pseudomonas syringae pv. antirrhini str. 126]
MANIYSTETPTFAGFASLPHALISALQNEKISCSFSPFVGLDPAALLGRHVYVQHEQEYSSQLLSYEAVVIGFQVGAVGYGIESQLLLRAKDGSDDEYVPVSALTVLAVFS